MHDSIGDMIVDCLQNSVEADASRIVLTVDETPDFLDVCIEDNGKGMSDEELKRATDPFYTDGVKHKHRKVGLERQPHRLTEDRRFAAGVFFNHDFQRRL